MRFVVRSRPSARLLVVAVVAALAALTAIPAAANVALTRISTDTFTNSTSQHATQVEPDTYAFGNTIVMAAQTGRFFDGGASGIAVARSGDNGTTWTNTVLPGITTFQGGPYDRVSDPAVAFDAQDNVWMVSSLAIRNNPVRGVAVITSRSTNGGLTWGNPVTTATGSNLDKNWIACDNTSTSPFFGNCYTEFDDTTNGNRIKMTTSTNGGLNWSAALNTGDNAGGLGGQPVVRPNGTVLVPINNANQTQIRSFRSINGGASWRATVLVANVQRHTVAGGLRTSPLPSAEMDSAGTAYVVWQDCRFRSGCTANDIVMSKSTSETTWGPVTRVPIDATNSGRDHFIPGIGVDRTTSGGSARIGLTYYFYPVSNCTAANCQLDVGYVSSTNGGSTWSAATQVTGPMTLSWLANTSQGRMVGDYISTSVFPVSAGGRAYPVIAVANPPSGTVFDEAMYVPTGGLAVTGGSLRASSAGAHHIPGTSSSGATAGPQLRR